MPDRKPPAMQSGELDTVRCLIRYQRESFVRKLEGVGEADARRAFVGSGTTLVWLTRHIAGAETTWVLRRFAGLDVPMPSDVPDDASLADAITAYRATWADVDAVLDDVAASADALDRLCDNGQGSQVNLRWVLMHLLEETARHAGHVDILRELIDGTTGR